MERADAVEAPGKVVVRRTRLHTRPATTHAHVAAFFDSCAQSYEEQHGDRETLLRYRLRLIGERARLSASDTVLEIGCGDGVHLIALADRFQRGLGTDLSPRMIEAARQAGARSPSGGKLSFSMAASERLESVGTESMDVVLCVGSLEHVIDQSAALRAVFRVLKPGGRFVCLTLNGGSLWYRRLASWLGIDTRHLATDHFATRAELEKMTCEAGFASVGIDSWTFIQRGDIPRSLVPFLESLDRLGRLLKLESLRGGLRLYAVK